MSGVVTVGARNGRVFKLQRAPLSDVLFVESNAMAWHLWIGADKPPFLTAHYAGNFNTKREALDWLEAQLVQA
jgi:hypothetical protein